MARTSSTRAPLPQIKPAALRKFHAAFTSWYAAHGRHDLPWRKTDDAYAIWLSEVMLQQTQVSTVLARFYHPFLTAFPTIESLAEAPREAVMKAWEGLGYYRRAGYLHDAAKTMVASAKATRRNAPVRMPDTLEGLQALSGIGRNTAAAILAFAYHQPVAIMEANVKRIVARIFVLETPTDDQLWQGAEILLDRDRPFNHNQAIMDLGSLLCTPKKPACPLCPAKDICLGKENAEHYPAPKTKKATPVREVDILVERDAAGHLRLTPRETALLGGLYGFAQVPRTENHMEKLGDVVHVYSHFRLEGRVFLVPVAGTKRGPAWHSRDAVNALPLSAVDHKVLALVDNCNSARKKQRPQ